MSEWRKKFNWSFEAEWHNVNDRLPLDRFKLGGKGEWGMITSVLVLILDEEDLNDDPSIVSLEFCLDHDGTERWCFHGGEAYHECHTKNIKYWCDEPDYTFESVMKAYKHDEMMRNWRPL
jgi:hypothetical protein